MDTFTLCSKKWVSRDCRASSGCRRQPVCEKCAHYFTVSFVFVFVFHFVFEYILFFYLICYMYVSLLLVASWIAFSIAIHIYFPCLLSLSPLISLSPFLSLAHSLCFRMSYGTLPSLSPSVGLFFLFFFVARVTRRSTVLSVYDKNPL